MPMLDDLAYDEPPPHLHCLESIQYGWVLDPSKIKTQHATPTRFANGIVPFAPKTNPLGFVVSPQRIEWSMLPTLYEGSRH